MNSYINQTKSGCEEMSILTMSYEFTRLCSSHAVMLDRRGELNFERLEP